MTNVAGGTVCLRTLKLHDVPLRLRVVPLRLRASHGIIERAGRCFTADAAAADACGAALTVCFRGAYLYGV